MLQLVTGCWQQYEKGGQFNLSALSHLLAVHHASHVRVICLLLVCLPVEAFWLRVRTFRS
jgi:hypothetical protein